MADPVGILIFKEKQTRLLLMLFNNNKEWHLTDLARAANVTYVHTSRFIGRCEEVGLISSEKHGRTKRIFLTEKGSEVAQGIVTMMSKLQVTPAKAAAAAPAKQAATPAPQKEAEKK